MTARVASCPECLGGKVNLYTVQCGSCGHQWLSRSAFDDAVKLSFASKQAYLQSEVYKDLEELVTISKMTLLDTIETQISKSLGYAEEEFNRLQNDTDHKKAVRVEVDVLDAVMSYLRELRETELNPRTDDEG